MPRKQRLPTKASGASELPELVTVDDVATWLKTTTKAIYAKAERGNLAGAVHVGRRLYFIRSELVASLEQGRIPYLGKSDGRA